MIDHIEREEAQAAVMADLGELAYYATCQAELTGIDAELPQARERLAAAENRHQSAADALRVIDRKRREAQAARILSENVTEQAELSAQIAALDGKHSNAQADLTSAHNRLLTLRGDVDQLERRRANLARVNKPAAENLRAALALLDSKHR